ncbi:MAG: hypothetical protein ACLFSE_02565 [Spirochaetia bacterium]
MKLADLVEAEAKKGRRALKNHQPREAVLHFRRALDLCRPEQKNCLCRILYYLGISLQKLGMTGGALRSWSAAAKIKKKSRSAHMLKRYANEYGMPKQKNGDLDDYKAFYSVQLLKYLNTKQSRKIVTQAEGDMIKALITDNWKVIKRHIALRALNSQDKMTLFSQIKIIFPFYVSDEFEKDNTVEVDFNKKQKMYPETKCRCGSGLPYKLCCGRIPGQDEIVIGVF